ncbi:hypothetical protein HAX54_043526 [Datura stramonium]|uniref:RWP-RK domain-containing protein n=1 Tax=Datura stramonium TaxID=4076 RepID=A0ABS8SN90_DATST|nr:hypothetical protein [Datura stramonium]
MRSTLHCALLQAYSSTKSQCQSIQSLIACDDSKNELFIATDYRYGSCQFFIPCGNCNGCFPCRVSSVVYILHLYAEELPVTFPILGSGFDVKSSYCNSSFKFSYRTEHFWAGHAQPCRFHGSLSLSLFIPTEKSPVGLFEAVHCPQKAIFPLKGQRCPVPNKRKQSSSSPYLDSTVVRCSSNRRQMLLHLLQSYEHSINVGHESPEVIVEKRRNKSSTPWCAAGSISKEDLVQRYGMRVIEAARSLRVSVSTFKRLCRVHGISRWPSAKKTRENASVSQSPNALLSSLQQMSGISQTTKENDMTQGRASSKQEQLYRSRLLSDSLSFENPTPNALERIPQPPENGMICEEDREISISRQKRRLETEADSMDEMSDFSNQPSEILNYAAPKRQAVDSARKQSSCLTSISGTIEGTEVGYNATPESGSEKQSHLSPYLDSMVVQHSSNGQQMLLHLSPTHESSTNAGHGSPGFIIDTQTKNHKTRNKSSSPWSAVGSIYLEDLVQCYGMRRYEAAASLGVSVSTFKRLCREHGLPRWPTAKKMRENASVSQSPNALVSSLQHEDANLSLNQNMPGNSETTKENSMRQERASAEQEMTYNSRQYKRRTDTLSSTLNALARMPQPPENLMMCEEDRETDISRNRRRQREREADSMDEVIHSNKQPSETLNRAPEGQAVDSARKKSSCLTSTIEGIGVGYNPTPESVSDHVVNEFDSTCTGVKLSLGSTSTQSLNPISSDKNTTQDIMLLFSNLIALPLEDLINPENEASMKKTLSILADNLSMFPEEQAKQILELKFDFPILVHSWREFSRSQMCSQEFFADLEKIRDLVGNSMKDEESLKARYGELESKEKELMAQLEAVLKEKAGITEQMHKKFKQTKHLASLADERAARSKEKIQEMRIATTKLNSLVDQWAKIQSLFI